MKMRGVHVIGGDLTAGLASAFASVPRVAWDIETSGLDWRREQLGTCQLFADEVGVVIVSLAGEAPGRLVGLLEDRAVEKVFHHAPFDLRFMVHSWGARPASVRCTKVASKLLDPAAPQDHHTLQALVSRHLGVELRKGAVRTSNWSAASLTDEQVEYAMGDVLHLLALLNALEDALKAAGLAGLYDDCCAFLPARVALEIGGYPDVFAY